MDKIIMLGTGHAMTSECYNTCFVYENEHGRMLVDTGGGQQLLGQFQKANIHAEDISLVFISHKHTDHLLGLPWLLRMRMRSLGQRPLTIMAHSELCETAKQLLVLLLPELIPHFGSNLLFIPVDHGQHMKVLGRDVRFFDTCSDSCTQFGFVLTLADGASFAFLGDVPYCPANKKLLENAKWLMHEAFCLAQEQKGGMKKHSSVAQAAKNAAELASEGLILVHGSDNDLPQRQERYKAEAAENFGGNILVPNDLDAIDLS